MARPKKPKLVKITIHMTLDDKQALESAALTLDRDPAWVLCKVCHLSVGTIDLSKEIRRWLRGDTAFDAGLTGGQKVLLTIGNEDDPVVRAERRKTVAQDPPTVEGIAAHIAEKGYGFTAEEFYDHYVANGWRQANGNPLLDWKAACRNPWQKNYLERHPGQYTAPASEPWGAHRPPNADEAVAALSAAILAGPDDPARVADPDGDDQRDEEEGFLTDEEA